LITISSRNEGDDEDHFTSHSVFIDGSYFGPQQQALGSSPIINILSSPMAKAVLAGIAAMVIKRVVGR